MATIIPTTLARRMVKPKSVALKDTLLSNSCNVEVEFFENISKEETVFEIAKLSNPQILLWYIGPNGLKNKSVDFYRDSIISPILNINDQATFWLVDLTAWGAFKNPMCSVHAYSKHCQIIEAFTDKRIQCIKSAKIISKIREVKEKRIISHFKKSIKKDFIVKISENFPDNKIFVRDVFPNNCPIFADWHDCNITKFYSSLQYLEGCFLVNEILSNLAVKNKTTNVEIVFALPNNEFQYYKDEFSSFQKDLHFFISKQKYSKNTNMVLNIKFFSFKYGTQQTHRPYNEPGKTLGKDELSYIKVVGQQNEDSVIHKLEYATNQ